MPDWAPVPNLPSVQATVASAQPAHLLGVDHIDNDGFAKGFNSVMQMRTIAGKMELWKLIQQSTNPNGTIDWAKYNTLAKNDKDSNLALAAIDFEKDRRAMQSDQANQANEFANQQARLNTLVQKGYINSSDAQKMQQGINARTVASGAWVGSGGSGINANPTGAIDALDNTMLKHMTNINDGKNQYAVYQTPTNQLVNQKYTNRVSPSEKAQIAANINKTQSGTGNNVTTNYNHFTSNDDGTLTNHNISSVTATQEAKSGLYAGYLKQAPQMLSDFNVNQNNLLKAISLAYQSQNETSKTGELASMAQLLGLKAKDIDTPPMLLSKYLAQVEKNLNDNGHANSVAALENAKKALGENAPYKVIALAAMAEYENEIADALKYSIAQNTQGYDGFDQLYNKQIMPKIMDYAQAMAFRKLYKFDKNAANAWGDTLHSLEGKKFGITLNHSINAINAAIKKDRRIYNTANTMGYPME